MENQQMQIQMDPNMYYLTMANITTDEEQTTFMMVFGNQARRYVLSPKHAKRFMLLLDKQIADYEAKFGAIDTELPPVNNGDTAPKTVGFQPNNGATE